MAKYRVFRGDPEHKQVALYDNFLGGMNTTDIDSNVKTNEFRLLQNVELAEEGRIQKRKGWRNYETLNNEFFKNFPRVITDIYYFNVYKDERAIFNNLDFHVGPYELWFDIIFTSGDNLFYGVYKLTRNNLNEVNMVEEVFALNSGGDYKAPNINEVDVLNYGGRRYLLLNQIVENSEEIIEIYQNDEGSNVVRSMNKNNSFTPNAYDANLVGFNIFKENPLDISITTTGQSAILQTYILEYGETIESSKLYDSIFPTGQFTLAVVYSGPSTFIESLNLKLYKLGLEGKDYIDATITEVNTSDDSSWAYYNITIDTKPYAGQDIGIEFTKLDDEDIKTENVEPYTSYKDLFDQYHNKVIQGDTFKPNMLVKRVSANKYELMEGDPNHPFNYRKLRYKDNEGNFTMTVDEPVYLSYDSTYRYFRRLTSDGIIYGELGTYNSQRYNTFSVNTLKLSNSRIFDNYLIRDNETVNVYNRETADINEIKNIKTEEVPELVHKIKWTGARAVGSYGHVEWAEIISDSTTYERKRTVTVGANKTLSDYGITGPSHQSRELSYANNYLRNADGTYTPNDFDTVGNRYNIITTTFSKSNPGGPPEFLGEFSAVLVGDVPDKDSFNLDNYYSNYDDYVLNQTMNFKLKEGNDEIIVHYNGKSDPLGPNATEEDYKEYFTEGTADFVTYDYNEILKVRNSEPIVIESIDFKTMKGLIINDKLVLYTHNTIIWSDDFSTRRDESSSEPSKQIEQSFSYFPNHNWATLPLAYNDSIQKISYYRGSWIIFTKESIYRMNGEFTPDEMEIVLINDVIGCIAPGSIRGINNTLIFLTEDGLYALRQNYYQEGLENVVKIDDLIKGIIPYGTNYESIVHGEQYLLHTKDFEGNYINTIKQYYNMVNTSKTMPYTVDIYRESPVSSFRHLGSLYGFNNGQLYKYGEGYTDFMPLEASLDDIDDYAYEMIIETPDWDLEHPLHEKKYKNLFMKFNSTHEVLLNLILTFDRNIEVTNEDFTIEMNYLGELEYIRNFDPNLRTDGRLELGRGKLAQSFLGFEGYQVIKIDPSAKGRVMKIRLENNTADRIAIDAVSIVYKLGKMRESV